MTAQIEWKQEVANGNVSSLRVEPQDTRLGFRQLGTQCSVSNNVIYLKDCSAILNDTDFISATGSLNLRSPIITTGNFRPGRKLILSLEPVLRAFVS